jgi:hypothetical protein
MTMELLQTDKQPGAMPALIQRLGARPWVATVFFSAALIFLVQPMYAKMTTPLMGGAPAVWNVSLVCFQAALLGGYAYAHLLGRLKSLPLQVGIHVVLLCLAALSLPLSISGLFGAPDPAHPALWLTATFLVSIAPPFAILSATAPLIQNWYARSGRHDAADPYHLYSASNAGSLFGLMAYPLLMEPFSTLSAQSLLWSGGYGLVALLLVTCGLIVIARHRQPVTDTGTPAPLAETTRWTEKGYWLLLSAIPSGLLLATTSHISTDIASAPFLWAPPLIAYIATFIIVFAKTPLIPPAIADKYLLFAVGGALLMLNVPIFNSQIVVVGLVVHIGALFMAALCLHGALVARRPAASGLTEFYLLMSLGGVIGSAFVALLAPMIFNDIHEYPLLLGAALLLSPRFLGKGFKLKLDTRTITISAIAVLAVGLAWSYVAFTRTSDSNTMVTRRGFFGVVKVYSPAGRDLTLMQHGNTIHGAQIRSQRDHPTPLAYYNVATPIGQAFTRLSGSATHVGIVGLGAGGVACHAQPGQSFTYYEIDPIVVEMATDTDHFTFLSSCTPDAQIMLGDARITLEQAAQKQYDLLLLDAFSSDAIPVHLLTREAMQLYLSRLSDDGVLVFHISNRHIDLVPVLARVAAAEQAVMRHQFYVPTPEEAAQGVQPTNVMIFAKSDAALSPFQGDSRWQAVAADDQRPWTDDYSNLIGAMLETHLAK